MIIKVKKKTSFDHSTCPMDIFYVGGEMGNIRIDGVYTELTNRIDVLDMTKPPGNRWCSFFFLPSPAFLPFL
jgi:hypothetical protein